MRTPKVYLIPVALVISLLSAYITHIIWCMNLLMNEASVTTGQGILIVLGTLVPPFGALHGILLWFS